MFLKSLDLFGFKSFADRTHIDFADGITALVGPNGCGKSNIVDAIKWVLAENKSRALRAEKMGDVIFNGTEKRPPMNIAEVTLTIMNESNFLPFEASEIAIRRRIYRSGENEYSINNLQVGPSEIRKLFMDTGVGKAAYSVMEQGKIDQILSKKPEDRRYLFEEAAGISRNKAECAEAERKLELTRINLQQAEASLSEIKRTYDSLKAQAEKALKYREIKEEIFTNELDIQLLRLRGFSEDKAHREAKLNEVGKARETIRREIKEINDHLCANADKMNKMQAEVTAKQSELIGMQKEKTGKLDLAKQFNTRAQEIKEKIAQLEAHKHVVQERIDNFIEEIGEQESSLHEKTKQLSDITKNIDEFKKSIEAASFQIEDNGRKTGEYKKSIEAFEKKIANLRIQLDSITENIVKELDIKLKETGLSEMNIKQAEEQMISIVGKLKVFASGRKNIFSDYATNTAYSDDGGKRISGEAAKAFEETERMLVSLEKALESYMQLSPKFLEEFLSPEGIITKKRAIDLQIRQSEESIREKQKLIADSIAANAELESKTEEYKETLNKLKINEAQMQGQISAAKQQAEIIKRSLASEENALRTAGDELYEENKRAENIKEQIITVQEELADIEVRGQNLAFELSSLDNQIKECNSTVLGGQDTLQKKNGELEHLQEKYEQLTMSLASLDVEIRNVKQNFIDTHSRDLMEFEERMRAIDTPAAVLREKLSAAKSKLASLGQVNLMAPEEFAEVKERYERKLTSYNDTLTSIENMQRIADEIRSKSAEMFMDAYNKIKRNFHNMFRRLFNGGKGELRLEDPQNVLTTGIDIFAQPPGKKLENIALLSGGEKTMTAVALLFATYQVRPSPFCLLDEIDAALDNKNVSSFVNTLHAFANISQYILITHNQKTVLGAGTLLGVTMQESGVSMVIARYLEQDIKTDENINGQEVAPFEEEDVEPEKNVYIPQRPLKRIQETEAGHADN